MTSLAYFGVFVALMAVASAGRIPLTKTISFKGIDVPSGPAINTHTAFTELTISGKKYPVEYFPIVESGKSYPSFTPGQTYKIGTVLDIFGKQVTEADDEDADPAKAVNFDRTTLFTKWGKIWAIIHNENDYGNLYLVELKQDSETGKLTVLKAKSLNLGAAKGLLSPCSGTFTVWGTHLLGEEDAPQAKGFPDAGENDDDVYEPLEKQAYVHRLPNWRHVNPYWYGYMVETSVINAKGDTSVGKRWSMGRFEHEIGIVMPDRKTVLLTDDSSDGGVFCLFVADKVKDLRKGRLFCAAVTQRSDVNGGEFSVRWLDVNPEKKSVDEKLIKNAVSGRAFNGTKIKFEDMFESVPVVFQPGSSTEMDLSQLPAGFKVIKTDGDVLEWLKLKPGMGAYASRLETRRMAAYVGATNEFTKNEGLAYDPRTNAVYLGFSAIQRSMTNSPTTYDLGGPNQMRLPVNEPGAVYRLKLGRASGVPSSFVPLNMKAILNSFGYNSSLSENSVPQTSIASPGNIGIMSTYSSLLISEDSGDQHLNNYLWAYNLKTGSLTRIFAAAYGAEVTSGYYFPNIGKFSYLTATQQEPDDSTGANTISGYWVLPRES